MSHVFISYEKSDIEFAENLSGRITKEGIATWTYRNNLAGGQEWRQAIDDAIWDAFALIVIMTPDAKQSEYVTYEWACAWGAKIPIIPILYKDTKNLHPRLVVLQYIDFTQNNRPWEDVITRVKVYENKRHQPIPLKSTEHLPRELLDLLNSIEISEALQAITILEQMDHPEVTDILISTSKQHRFIPVRINAALALLKDANFNDATILPTLILAYQYADYSKRAKILRLIGENKDTTGLKIILETLQDNQSFLKTEAEEALKQIGSDAMTELEKILINGNTRQREAATISLGVLKDIKPMKYFNNNAK